MMGSCSAIWPRFEQRPGPKGCRAHGTCTPLTRAARSTSLSCSPRWCRSLEVPGKAVTRRRTRFSTAWRTTGEPLGLPGLSINWGPWGGAGMAARVSDRDRSALAGEQGYGIDSAAEQAPPCSGGCSGRPTASQYCGLAHRLGNVLFRQFTPGRSRACWRNSPPACRNGGAPARRSATPAQELAGVAPNRRRSGGGGVPPRGRRRRSSVFGAAAESTRGSR